MNKPEITVVIPSYNRAGLITRAIESVLNQTFNNFELIIIDDASTDKTETVISQIKDKRLKYIKLENNQGPAFARNIGIKNSTTNLITFLDSDDLWSAQKLQRQFDEISKLSQDYGLVYVKSLINKGGRDIPYLPYPWLKKIEGDIFYELLNLNFIDTPAVMVRKNVFADIGLFDESLNCAEDYDLFLRVSRKYKVKLIDEYLMTTYLYEDGINMRSIEAHAGVLSHILQKYILFYNYNKKLYSNRLLVIGDLYSSVGNDNMALKYFNRSININRTNFKTWMLITGKKISLITGINLYNSFKAVTVKINQLITGKGGLH